MRALKNTSIDVTYRCNMRCLHCYNESNRIDPREMSSEKLIELSQWVGDIRTESICICGGEPLCRANDVIRMCSEIKERDPRKSVAMVSNGLLWTDDIARKLKQSGLDAVQFSIDGLTDDSYDAVRQSHGGLKRVKGAIGMAQSAGLRVLAACLPHRKNFDEIEQIIDFCAQNHLEEVRLQPLMPLGRGESNYEILRLEPSQQVELKRLLRNLARARKDIKIEWGDPVDHLFMLQQVDFLPQLSINAYGEALLSPYLPITVWDFNTGSMEDYLKYDIPGKALKHPLVKETLKRIVSVDDLTSKQAEMPELFLGDNINIMQDLIEMGQSDD